MTKWLNMNTLNKIKDKCSFGDHFTYVVLSLFGFFEFDEPESFSSG